MLVLSRINNINILSLISSPFFYKFNFCWKLIIGERERGREGERERGREGERERGREGERERGREGERERELWEKTKNDAALMRSVSQDEISFTCGAVWRHRALSQWDGCGARCTLSAPLIRSVSCRNSGITWLVGDRARPTGHLLVYISLLRNLRNLIAGRFV